MRLWFAGPIPVCEEVVELDVVDEETTEEYDDEEVRADEVELLACVAEDVDEVVNVELKVLVVFDAVRLIAA